MFIYAMEIYIKGQITSKGHHKMHGPIIFTGLETRYKKLVSNTRKISGANRQTIYQE
jgi:hypothetical protein